MFFYNMLLKISIIKYCLIYYYNMASYLYAHVCYLYTETQISKIAIIVLSLWLILYMKYV